jgi:multidrug efflux system membrane fusion protein
MPVAPNNVTIDSAGIAFTLSPVADASLTAKLTSEE